LLLKIALNIGLNFISSNYFLNLILKSNQYSSSLKVTDFHYNFYSISIPTWHNLELIIFDFSVLSI